MLMNNALLVGYFESDLLRREFYNLLAGHLREFGFALRGIGLSANRCDQYEFPIVSYGSPPPRRGVVARVLAKCERRLPRFRSDPSLTCYSEMQAQGTDSNATELAKRSLLHFRKRLERHCKDADVKLVILNHQFSGNHLIARDVCIRLGIPFFYWHPGFLPGTMCFDQRGQLAESEINGRLRNELSQCGADEEQLGETYRQWVKDHSYVRPGKTAASNADCLFMMEALLKKARKVLLVIGSNDYRTGMQPESYPNARLHSAVIRSSQALFEEAVKCTNESTFVVYKPHPNLDPSAAIEMVSGRSCRVFDVTIKDLLPLVDATVTLCSTAAYEALIFGTSTVIVGNLPGSDLGICHKPGADNFDLKEALRAALADEGQPSMEKRLNVLMGYLIKHYFFSSGSGACPLVKRDLRTALSEMLAGQDAQMVTSQVVNARDNGSLHPGFIP